MIKDYQFGLIVIDSKTYHQDVEVRWTGEVLNWWRKEGHIFNLEDIERALKENPEIIVLGTGALGIAKVTEELQEKVSSLGIQLIIDKTREATKAFNKILEKEKRVIGLFHLTC
jgi:hypothetical protein